MNSTRDIARLAPFCIVLLFASMSFLGCRRPPPPPDKQQAVRSAEQFLQQRAFVKAAAAYRTAVAADPTDGSLRLTLAKTYVDAGNYSAAAAEAVRASDLLPNDSEAQLYAAELMLSQNRYIDVIDRMSAFLDKHPDSVRAVILRANGIAHLMNSTWAIYSLAAAIRSGAQFDGARLNIRPATAISDDERAEREYRRALAMAPELPEPHVALANFLWAVGRPDDGEPYLAEFVKLVPGHAAANYALGTYYLSRHRIVDGERFLKAAANAGEYGKAARITLIDFYIDERRDADALALLTQLPADEDVNGAVSLRIARVDFRSGRTDEALAKVDAVLAKVPTSAPAFVLKSQVKAAQKQWDEAVKFGRSAVAADTTSDEAHAALGRALAGANQREDAFAELTDAYRLNPDADDVQIDMARLAVALGRANEAVALAKDAKRRRPRDPEVGFLVARALAFDGQFDAADVELRALGSNTATVPRADLFSVEGQVQAGRRDLVKARAAFMRALAIEATHESALAGLIDIELREKRPAAARARLDALLKAHDDASSHLIAARVYNAENDSAAEERSLRRALELNPRESRAAVSLAALMTSHGRDDEGLKFLTDFVAKAPNALDANLALAGQLAAAGRSDEAKAIYERQIGIHPDAAAPHIGLARLLVDRGDNLDIAMTHARAANRLNVAAPESADTIGWIYVAKNMAALGLPFLRDAVRQAPDDPTFRFHLGYALLQLRKPEEAAANFSEALALNPTFPEADKAKELLAGARRQIRGS